jgi:hypothetical protein
VNQLTNGITDFRLPVADGKHEIQKLDQSLSHAVDLPRMRANFRAR